MGIFSIFKKKKSNTKIIPSPKHNYHFSKEILNMIKHIELTFKEVHPLTFEEWIDGFDRDANPEKEIAIWLYMANKYRKIIMKYPNNSDYHKEIYKTILLCTMGDDKYVLSQIKEKKLSQSDIKSIIKEFRHK